jgi:hypothetical protein
MWCVSLEARNVTLTPAHPATFLSNAYGGALSLGAAVAGNRHEHFARTRRLLRITTLARLRGAALADVVQAPTSASIRLTTLPVSRGSRLRFWFSSSTSAFS